VPGLMAGPERVGLKSAADLVVSVKNSTGKRAIIAGGAAELRSVVTNSTTLSLVRNECD
jgi:hypothetical protein